MRELSDKAFPGETSPCAPDREPQTGQSANTTKVQFAEPRVLLGLLTSVWIRDYRDASSKVLPGMGDSSQSWEPKAYCTACRQLNRQKSVLSR